MFLARSLAELAQAIARQIILYSLILLNDCRTIACTINPFLTFIAQIRFAMQNTASGYKDADTGEPHYDQ